MKPDMKLGDAVLVKSAEYWLELGQPVQALLELQKLTSPAQAHPWSTTVLRKAFRAARGVSQRPIRTLVA